MSACVQVYGIVSAQLILTAIVAGIIYAVPPVRGFVTTSLAFQLTFAILPLAGELLWHAHAAQPSVVSSLTTHSDSQTQMRCTLSMQGDDSALHILQLFHWQPLS